MLLLWQFIFSILLTLTSVQAKPHYGYGLRARDPSALKARDLTVVGTGCNVLVAGAKSDWVGTVCAKFDGCTLIVTYTFFSNVSTVDEVHVGVSPR